jgi:hypothetical protein
MLGAEISDDDLLTGIKKIAPDVIAIRFPESKWISIMSDELATDILLPTDATRFSELLNHPVLTASIFDSDSLVLFFADAAKGIQQEHLHCLSGLYEEDECDESESLHEFPEYLLDFCNPDLQDELREVWTSDEEVFEENILARLFEILNIPLVFNEDDIELTSGIRTVGE